MIISFGDFDAEDVVRRIDTESAVSIPDMLAEPVRRAMLDELEQREMREQPKEFGKFKTKQAFTATHSFEGESVFNTAAFELQMHLRAKFAECAQYPLTGHLDLSDRVAQRYQPTSVGISPHRDNKSFINLIVILVLEGEARFCVCDDREGTNPRPIRNLPGDVLLMRGPGFLGADVQPFHFVDRVTSQRTSFALRQKR